MHHLFKLLFSINTAGITVLPCIFFIFFSTSAYTQQTPDLEQLKNSPVLDDYDSNVLLGFNIINQSKTYAGRFVGNQLNCSSCHRNSGTLANQLPLNIAGMYPHWRAKNAQIIDLSLKIRECFVYALNGVMPPANAPEIIAIKTYISYLSNNQIIGKSPQGRGVITLPVIVREANPTNGQQVYQQHCAGCHATDGSGNSDNPAVWGLQSYSAGSAMNNIQLAAGFIKSKMNSIGNLTLSSQQALDVAAFLNQQLRPADPDKSKIPQILQDLLAIFQSSDQ